MRSKVAATLQQPTSSTSMLALNFGSPLVLDTRSVVALETATGMCMFSRGLVAYIHTQPFPAFRTMGCNAPAPTPAAHTTASNFHLQHHFMCLKPMRAGRAIHHPNLLKLSLWACRCKEHALNMLWQKGFLLLLAGCAKHGWPLLRACSVFCDAMFCSFRASPLPPSA